MPRPAALAIALALAAPFAGVWAAGAHAADAAPQPMHMLSWPGKAGDTTQAAPSPASTQAIGGSTVALSKQFFGGASTDDLAAPPPPLMPRPVPGTQAVTSTATENTASNRARQTALETADSAADGPVGGAGSSN
jgi:hypothetical protein